MPHNVSWFDRMRIERVVWMLDQRLYDLPRRSRIDKRREVRANLRAAASDIDGAIALAQSPHLKKLKVLELFGNEIGTRGASALKKRFGSGLHL